MSTWVKSKYPGVYYREHKTRRHGSTPDRYLTIRYTTDRRHQEALGWTSKGWNEVKASNLVGTIKENARTGEGPTSLAEIRALNTIKRQKQRSEAMRNTMTFEVLAERYMAWAQRAKSSWKEDRGRLDHNILPFLGRRLLGEITTTTVNELKAKLEDRPSKKTGRPLAPATIVQCLSLVRQIFNFARETPLDPKDPRSVIFNGANPAMLTKRKGYGVRIPVVDNARMRTLTPGDEKKLYKAALDLDLEDHRDILQLAFDTGLRRSEIVRIRKEHVHGKAESIHLLDTKGGLNRIAYPKRSRCMLMTRIQRNESPFLFPGIGGRKRDADAITRTTAKIIKRSNLNDGAEDPRMRITLHTARHTFATRLYIESKDLFLVQRRLGHADISTTQKYVHLAEDLELRTTAEKTRASAGQ